MTITSPLGHVLRDDEGMRLEVVLASADGPWELTVDLSRDDNTTTMVFVHRMAEPYDATGIGAGWHFHIDRFDAEVAGAQSSNVWDDYFPSLSASYGLPD
ncbi:MAG: hypothetical protein JJE52_08425 [Acidimicrobiia bacterium]|nr:hypothetical protein [Acidimicrobiia bacterium]